MTFVARAVPSSVTAALVAPGMTQKATDGIGAPEAFLIVASTRAVIVALSKT